jgi:aminopeptidase N
MENLRMRRIAFSTVALALALAGLCSLPAAAATPVSAVQTTTQLPRNVRPTHYDVAITPDAKNLRFDGKVTIAIEVLQPTDSITLNAIELDFKRVSLAGKTPFAAPKVEINAKEQTATFTFAKPIAKGSYRLTLDYSGKIGTQAAGLFALDYPTAEGQRRAVYSQFENSDARRMIPSWDEPNFKTTFRLEATVPAGQVAINNMPIEKQTTLPDGRVLVRFGQSPKMSTYLLFFGLGEFERATVMAGATEIGVITKKGALGQAAFVLDSSKAVLAEYNDYFGVPYPLPKLDNIAAPGRSQFFGAMENWGAIFSFESVMLLDPAISTQTDKQRAFNTAAHEMAHQWFGDLVTMRWWDDLWLNEGFASWMTARTTIRLHPEWDTVLSSVRGREAAMARDSLATTHPVVQHIETVEQASQAFDSITYQKGQAVISMLEDYVGEDAWRKGVRQYMQRHKYGNTVSDDLWREVDAASGQPVTAIAHDFTLQPGVPMIRVDSATCVDGSTSLQLSQDEFSKDRTISKPLRWRVPVTVQALGAGAPVRTLVSDGKVSMRVPGCAPVIVNAGQRGYYRTVYTAAQTAALVTNFAALPAIDQLGILSDSWELGTAGVQPPAYALDLAKATPLDANSRVWAKIAEVMTTIDLWYTGHPQARAAFRQFAQARLTPKLNEVGWIARSGEADTVAILRNQLIDALGRLGDPAVIGEARRRFAASMTDRDAIPGPLRKTVFGVLATHADAATWDRLHAAAMAEKTPLLRDGLYDLLASTEDDALARRALELALTPEPGETNSAAMISAVSRLHPDMAFDFAMANLTAVQGKIDASSRSRYVPRLGRMSTDPAMIGKMNAYAEANLAAGSRGDAANTVAEVSYRIKVRKERRPAIDAWLAQQ